MSSQAVELDDALFGADGNFAKPHRAHDVSPVADENYVMRYLNFFAPDALRGLRVGVYQHSAVGRDVLVKILSHLGAEVTPLGRSEKFIPVDTEAIRPEDVQLAADWAAPANLTPSFPPTATATARSLVMNMGTGCAAILREFCARNFWRRIPSARP